MKVKITKREEKQFQPLCLGYCELYYILDNFTPLYYTSNAYGRRSDIYRIETEEKIIYISTGYAPEGRRPEDTATTDIKYNKFTRKLEEKAIEGKITREQKRKKQKEKAKKLLLDLYNKAYNK